MGRGKAPPVILAFGGLDPTGGAGILMDAAAIRAAGGYAAAVPSCIALQTTASFGAIVPIARTVMDRALASAASAFRFGAVKIGMVGTNAAARAILAFLDARPGLPVVVDPVLRSSTGAPLLRAGALPAYRALLLRAGVLTPNLPEIGKILGREIGSFDEAILAASDLAARTGAEVLLKGGHFPWKGRRGTDILVAGDAVTLLAPKGGARRRDPHGTGCALAAAVAARIARGERFVPAVATAKRLLETMVSSGFASAEGRWTLFGPCPTDPGDARGRRGERSVRRWEDS